MLTEMRLQGFKSWRDTGRVELRPITGFFGANSSGKTSLLQALLLLKQTVERADRGQVFHFGGGGAPVDLGDFADLAHGGDAGSEVGVSLGWTTDSALAVRDGDGREIVSSNSFGFSVAAARNGEVPPRPAVNEMTHRVGGARFGMRRNDRGYRLFADAGGFEFRSGSSCLGDLPPPSRCHGFPPEARNRFRNADFLLDLQGGLERQLDRIYYLGPLRAYPKRRYFWTGARPSDMGPAGELAVEAILASGARGDLISMGRGKKRRTLEEQVAHWLRELGLAHSFRIEMLAPGLYQVLVRQTERSPEVPITDVGFGVSQILPALVLCFYVPEGSTIVLEHPEIHLHPVAQSGLADALVDAWRRRKVQILIESHSESLLRRLQLRISEGRLESDEVGLWFCDTEDGRSCITQLSLDVFGSIRNWPENFFGDQFGEVISMAKNRLKRGARA